MNRGISANMVTADEKIVFSTLNLSVSTLVGLIHDLACAEIALRVLRFLFYSFLGRLAVLVFVGEEMGYVWVVHIVLYLLFYISGRKVNIPTLIVSALSYYVFRPTVFMVCVTFIIHALSRMVQAAHHRLGADSETTSLTQLETNPYFMERLKTTGSFTAFEALRSSDAHNNDTTMTPLEKYKLYWNAYTELLATLWLLNKTLYIPRALRMFLVAAHADEKVAYCVEFVEKRIALLPTEGTVFHKVERSITREYNILRQNTLTAMRFGTVIQRASDMMHLAASQDHVEFAKWLRNVQPSDHMYANGDPPAPVHLGPGMKTK